ncbi:MAG: class I SAM-dependent methyltransferase, partial [Actinomycetota bacterium]|nr:class I SAM-dependent methyltransferase [Actinomycetota bacterium]
RDSAPERRFDPGSFRDPGSRVFHREGKVYRVLDQRSMENWKTLEATRFFSDGVDAGRIVDTVPARDVEAIDGEEWAGVLEHEQIPVISYPYEWTFSMLRDAAMLQLDLLSAALAEDMILKDSTPFNVQWRGRTPVFIDIGSFEPLNEGDVWVGYRQFLAQYLYPLMLTAHVGVPFQPWFRGRPDGLTAEDLRRVMSSRDLLRKSGLLHVTLPARAERRVHGGGRDVRSELKDAGFAKEMIESNVDGLSGIVSGLDWKPGSSRWNEYATECDHVRIHRGAKAAFIAKALGEDPPGVVWDVGANDGYFSDLAATSSGYVLALDADAVILDEFYRSLSPNGPDNVLPIVQDLADPSPGIGWRGLERPPLVDRSSPDVVLCLAVVHHLVIGRNIPLRAVIDWLADLKSRVILEFVSPDDPMVQALTINKMPHEVHRDYNETDLRRYVEHRFVIESEDELAGGTRRLFALRPIG